MKTITIYQANDGSRFDEKNEAIKYEELCDKCDEINSRIPTISRNLEYNEYIQQNTKVVKQAFCDFMDVIAEAIPDWKEWAIQTKNGERHISHIGRVLSDYNIKCLHTLYFRFECISFDNGREYQQPYFVKHQDEATIKVN